MTTETKTVAPLPSIEEFADKTGNSLRKVIKGALLSARAGI